MTFSVENWQFFLRDSHGAAALPLLVAGLGMMLFGWRLWRLCVVCSFAIIGGGVFMSYFGTGVAGSGDWVFGVGGAVLFGIVSYWPAKFLVAILGGIVAGGAAMAYLKVIGVTGGTQYALSAAVMLGGTAYAFLNRQHVVVLLTSFLGAAAMVSGVMAIIMTMPGLHTTYRAMVSYNSFVAPFVLLVPTVMSCFYQIAEMRRLNTKF